MRRPGLALALALGAGLLAAPARADIYGLVVGIDDYTHIAKLKGAANDARDIAAALKTAGARDVRLLLDKAADRDGIFKAWKELVAKAPPDSTLVFSYAGHGGQEAERVAGTEEDGLDEVLLLAGFDTKKPGNLQRIIDDEIAGMLAEAAPRTVIFIADACHSGTMTRSLDARAGKPGFRVASYGPIEDDEVPLPPADKARDATADQLPHVTYFAAVRDNELAPEVEIDGHQRGALSWSFARAMRGDADADGDKVLTKGELERFIRENVRMKLEGRQHPQVTPAGRGEATLVSVTAPPAAPAAAAAPEPLRLRILNPPGGDAGPLFARLKGVAPAADADADPAALTWDAAAGEVVNGLGDVVAKVGAAEVQSVIDKWALLRRLDRDAERRSLEMTVTPDDRRYRENEMVTLSIGGHRNTGFTLFNLAADGTVNFLYPLDDGRIKDPPQIPAGKPYPLKLKVTPPFGADHFVAIASARPLEALHRDLKALDGKPAAAQVAALLTRHLDGQSYEIGVHGVYSAAKADQCRETRGLRPVDPPPPGAAAPCTP